MSTAEPLYETVAIPPPSATLWVTTTDGTHLQVCNIVRFKQVAEGRVMITMVDGHAVSSDDPAFFPVTP
jgi:hypothetical protein